MTRPAGLTRTSLPSGAEQPQAAERWARDVLAGWGYPAGHAARWLAPAGPVWLAAQPVEVLLECDADLGLVTIELRRDGRVVYGLDDWLGPPAP